VKSRTTERFRRAFADLPESVQRQAREAYRLFQDNPAHPGLRFRQVHPTRPIFSARVNLDYRALAIREGETVVWFWIGNHDEYERLLGRA
jgi:hypothetical protein